MPRRPVKSELSQLKNIGATIEQRLNEIGVYTRAGLGRIGPVAAYQQIKENHPDKTIAVCYYLYSLQGALDGVHWDTLPEKVKARLRKQASQLQSDPA